MGNKERKKEKNRLAVEGIMIMSKGDPESWLALFWYYRIPEVGLPPLHQVLHGIFGASIQTGVS